MRSKNRMMVIAPERSEHTKAAAESKLDLLVPRPHQKTWLHKTH